LVPERRLPGNQARLAFALLVTERSDALSMERIADILWDGQAPESWDVALRAIVSKLRRALVDIGGDATIQHAFGCYQLRLPSNAWVDIEAAAAAAHDAEAALHAGDLEAANGAALVANAIARRPFLEGADGEWVRRQRGRFQNIQVRALSCRAEVAHAHGDYAGAIGDAERVIAFEPYREQAYVTLMRAQVGSGNNAEALATYQRLRSVLTEDLGADPSPATEAAFVEVLGAT